MNLLKSIDRAAVIFIVALLAFIAGTKSVNAQSLNHVGWGGGPMSFPNEQLGETKGFAGYLSLGFENDKVRTVGGTLIIAGDSQISRGGNENGTGFVGLVGFSELNVTRSGSIRFGVFAGGGYLQFYERLDAADTFNGVDLNPLHTPVKMKRKSFQPYGGVKVGIGPVEIQYAPVSKMVTVGFRLYKG